MPAAAEVKKRKTSKSAVPISRQVRDWMTAHPYTCTPETTLADANDILDERNFRRLPVVDEVGDLIGMLSRSDLRSASPSSITSLSLFEVNYMWAKLTVSDVMTVEVATITPQDSMRQAGELMLAHKVSALPVVEGQRLVGILTETDMLRFLVSL
jgi:acetoin utilization protein AcuB